MQPRELFHRQLTVPSRHFCLVLPAISGRLLSVLTIGVYMRNFVLFLFSIFLASSSLVRAETNPPVNTIAVFDMRRALQTVADGKKARDTLQKEVEATQKKLAGEAKKIQDSVDELRKQSMVLDEKSRREKEEAIQMNVAKLREQEMKAQSDFQGRDQEISLPIVKKLREIIGKLSKDRGFSIVLNGDESTVIFSQQSVDLTDDVIKLYDSKK